MTVSEAAKYLGLERTTVRMYLTQGRLCHYKFKGMTLVGFGELQVYRQTRKTIVGLAGDVKRTETLPQQGVSSPVDSQEKTDGSKEEGQA